MGRVFTIASAKGGVGKTTTTAALGTTLAAAGADVVVVDGDIGMANLATVLGFDPDGPTLHAVLSGDAAVEDATYEGPAGLSIVPGSTDIDDFREADATDLGHVVEALRADYDYVLLDTGAGLSHDNALPLGLADEVVLVSSPEPPALIDTDKTRQLADRLDADVRGLVLTRVTENVTFEVPSQVNLDIPMLARIPYDEAVVTAFAARKPLCTHDPESPAAAAYRDLAEELTGESIPVPSTESNRDAGADEESDLGSLPDDFEEIADDFEEIAADVAGTDHVDAAATDSPDASDDDADPVEPAGPDDAAESAAEPADDDAGGAAERDESAGAIDTGVATALERAESTVDGGDGADDPSELVEEAEPPADAGDAETSEYPTVLMDDADGADADGDDSPGGDRSDDDDAEERERGGFFRRLLGG